MSLTSFLQIPDVRARFSREFLKPGFLHKQTLLAPPISKRYSLVGTAFDYLFRFYLKRLNPGSITRRWVAESGAELLASKQAYLILEKAKNAYHLYLQDGNISEQLIRSSLLLAHLDLPYRAGKIPDFYVDKKEIEELKQLISIVEDSLFQTEQTCILNPDFGYASRLVGGADADIILAHTLIDIKTVKALKLTREYFNQLLGYYFLSKIGQISGVFEEYQIDTLAIYYTRYAFLYKISIAQVVDVKKLPAFLDWFQKRAKEQFVQ